MGWTREERLEGLKRGVEALIQCWDGVLPLSSQVITDRTIRSVGKAVGCLASEPRVSLKVKPRQFEEATCLGFEDFRKSSALASRPGHRNDWCPDALD